MHLVQGSGYIVHLLLLDRQFSQHLIGRLRVRFSLTMSDSDLFLRDMLTHEELVFVGEVV